MQDHWYNLYGSDAGCGTEYSSNKLYHHHKYAGISCIIADFGIKIENVLHDKKYFMKKTSQTLFAVVLMLAACNGSETAKDTNTTSVNNTDTAQTVTQTRIAAPSKICYASSGKDSVTLSLTINETNVTGDLVYKIEGKDNNSGTFAGTINGDTLIGDYNFMAEGIQSTRQVAFLLKDNMAIEGYGDAEEKSGKMIFKNPSSLYFGKGISMKKIDCKN